MIKTNSNLKTLPKLKPQFERAIMKQIKLIEKEMLGESKGRPTMADTKPHNRVRSKE